MHALEGPVITRHDLALLKPRADDYAGSLPTAADTLLVVEVADTSLAFDLHTKSALYAKHGVPAYWVLDVTRGALHLHRDPAPAGYREVTEVCPLGRAEVPGLPGIAVDLTGWL